MPQLCHLIATCGINVSDMGTSHASRNVYRMDFLQEIDIEKMTELSFCAGCLAGKMYRKPFPTPGEILSTR